MKPVGRAATLALLFTLLGHTQARADETSTTRLFIGIEKNRAPYTYLDKQQQATGILITAVNAVCKKIKATCEFAANDFDTLLQNVQTQQLHGLVVIDALVLPDTDHIKLSPPLCKITPVFIQAEASQHRSKQEDFAHTTIGVQESSLLYLYLLDDYSSIARLKPYPLLESGVFDLVYGRIDAIFTDAAYFRARVENTPFGHADADLRLVETPADGVELPPTTMRLAVREQDTELLSQLEKAIPADPPACADLLDKPPPSPAPPPQTDAPKPEN
ncbi:transporter substrate-binding domain-containing protein [Candidatus Thiothrix sp. Deng01]|uniref:Transporter substrate-binding domain-containing protein n=1 Tax=Candidatus Thiothrix phosphatis TaxID=3112415 RepID=A0ABU6CWZ5_9GAMM|nr:transporter substrate-binding domain-containing protein [Candidatus Thiothrix sp. Deng01]MEB4591305.1 transporter substrate-binding domain-containing protein [Candidatus Thiothrix sp. Deng01]